jgi:hypothetical protein
MKNLKIQSLELQLQQINLKQQRLDLAKKEIEDKIIKINKKISSQVSSEAGTSFAKSSRFIDDGQ